MSIEERISQLIEKYRYETNKTQSEADVRANYIDWLFSCLGWDVWGGDPQHATTYHREGYIRGAGYVDVGLEIARQPVLMLEAKRFGTLTPSPERKYDRTPEERQLFKYARAKKIPYCILTNFERLHVFNADHERLILAFDNPAEYLDRLSELLHLSPERVKAGSLQASERQLELKDVDEAFLASLQSWRLQLANSIHRHNLSNPAVQTDDSFDFDKLIAAVQRVLDRLILIRYADDKEVLLTYDVIDAILSNYHKRGAYAHPDDLARDFIDLSHRMDERHNTTLFQPGHICEQVFIPNDILERIMEEMNNISFRKFTSDILGNTYETYLGTKLILKDGEIEFEERRDIRKAGGIFYTPQLIVHYIVDNTLGCLLNELEKQYEVHAIEKAKEIKVLDPACGSGSFLIYAYQVLANFYRRMNRQIENEQVKLLESVASPNMFKRLELLKQLPQPLLDYPHHILQKQLYGVDVDPEAAEIAAVNLTMQAFADAKQEKLPLILNENVKVGNSLISGGEQELRHYFGDNWKDKRPFNWEEEFPHIMKSGGFDIVIGNPPYVQMSMDRTLEPGLKRYFLETFGFSMGRLNTFGFFMHRGVSLLKQGGFLSYILPNTFLTQEYYRQLRKFLLDTCQIVAVTTLKGMLFEAAVVENAIVVLKKEGEDKVRGHNKVLIAELSGGEQRYISQSTFLESYNYAFTVYLSAKLKALRDKVDNNSIKLGELVNVNQAIALKHDRADCLFREPKGDDYKKVLDGRDIARYAIHFPSNYLLYNVTKIHSCKREDIFLAKEKILFRRVGDRVIAALDTEQHYALNTLIVVTPKSEKVNLRFILALMNSRLLSGYYRLFLKSTKKVFSEIQARQVEELSVRQIDFNNPEEKKMHDYLVILADKMLELNKRLALTSDIPSAELDKFTHEIESTDAEIDQKVYELYKLNKEERQIIEASFGS